MPLTPPPLRTHLCPCGAADDTSYDDTYYKDAEGKTGQALKDSLHRIISSTQTGKLTYSQVWDALKETDQDPDNSENVILLYTGRSQSKNSNGGNPDDWNREHVWAKSHGDFGTDTGPGTDIHHLRPEDVSVNSTRGNKDFDNGGTKVDEAPGNATDDDSFEPRDAVKGDVARMILYMAVRYDGGDGFADLEPNDNVDNGSQPHIGQALRAEAVEPGGPAGHLRKAPQPGDIRQVPAQQEPVHRPPRVGRRDLVALTGRARRSVRRARPTAYGSRGARASDGVGQPAPGRGRF